MRIVFFFYVVVLFFCSRQVIASVSVEVDVKDADIKAISIASQNLHRFFDDKDDPLLKEKVLSTPAYQANLISIAAHIKNSFRCPDVLLLQEVENKKVLQDLAKISCRGIKSYQVVFAEGFDPSGIDVGALVSENIHLLNWQQLATEQRLGNTRLPLYTRPPLLLRFSVNTTPTLYITAVVVHLRSMVGLHGKQHQRIVNKRSLQAEWLGRWIEEYLQTNDREYLLIAGDFNAVDNVQGGDNILGMIGNVEHPDEAVHLRNLNSLVPKTLRYTYVYRGQKQALDHMLVSHHIWPLIGEYKIIDRRFGKQEYSQFIKPPKQRQYFLDHNGLLLSLRIPSYVLENQLKTVE